MFLSGSFALTLYSTISMSADPQPLSGFQQVSPTPILEAALITKNDAAECMAIDDSNSAGWNAGEICLASDIESSATMFTTATGVQASSFMALQDIEVVGDQVSALGAECMSAGGSSEATGSTEGFCMAGDLSTSEKDFQNFSFKNGLPATGMQFLQAIFADGSTQRASGQTVQECISPDGSPSDNGNGNSGGFCMISSLKKSMTDFSVFSIANALPIVGLQFLQVKFADISSAGPPLTFDTECLSIGGSAAKTTGTDGGFCLASDLSTSAVESASFAVAHNAPVTDLQFLQVTFGGDSLTSSPLAPPGFGAPIGTECVSADGSIVVTDNPEGFCLVSDLIGSTGSATISVGNDLPVSGLQFLQVQFTNGGSFRRFPPSLGSPIGTECVSIEGSTSATGNVDGFCLVSDLINPTIGMANFSIANNLPVRAWEFLQVPSKDVSRYGGSTIGAPVGVVVSDFIMAPFDLRYRSSALADFLGYKMQYFHLSDQTGGMEAYSIPYLDTYPHLGLEIGR
jgi:hypothetical protein